MSIGFARQSSNIDSRRFSCVVWLLEKFANLYNFFHFFVARKIVISQNIWDAKAARARLFRALLLHSWCNWCKQMIRKHVNKFGCIYNQPVYFRQQRALLNCTDIGGSRQSIGFDAISWLTFMCHRSDSWSIDSIKTCDICGKNITKFVCGLPKTKSDKKCPRSRKWFTLLLVSDYFISKLTSFGYITSNMFRL